jgi:hypothetical protein
MAQLLLFRTMRALLRGFRYPVPHFFLQRRRRRKFDLLALRIFEY